MFEAPSSYEDWHCYAGPGRRYDAALLLVNPWTAEQDRCWITDAFEHLVTQAMYGC